MKEKERGGQKRQDGGGEKEEKKAGRGGGLEADGRAKEGSGTRPPPLGSSAGVPPPPPPRPSLSPMLPVGAPPFSTAQVTPLSKRCSEDTWEAGSGASPACGPQHCVLGTPALPQPHSGPSPLSRHFLHSFPRANHPACHPPPPGTAAPLLSPWKFKRAQHPSSPAALPC